MKPSNIASGSRFLSTLSTLCCLRFKGVILLINRVALIIAYPEGKDKAYSNTVTYTGSLVNRLPVAS